MSKKDDMKNIDDEVRALTSSPLYKYRTTNRYFPVIGEGSYDADIVFVGEAPGRNEAKTSKPFCGAAGKILDELLSGVGINRQDVYITNIVKDRPPENRDPTPEEIASYGPFLDRQIAIIKPKVIVTLGRYAMGYIMEKLDLSNQLVPIGKAHGVSYQAIAPWSKEAGKHEYINIVTLYHPCVAIYNRSTFTTLKADFKVLAQYSSKGAHKKNGKHKKHKTQITSQIYETKRQTKKQKTEKQKTNASSEKNAKQKISVSKKAK